MENQNTNISNLNMNIEEEELKYNRGILIGVLAALIVFPSIVLGILYNVDAGFRQNADNFISTLPGPLGDSKRNDLTPEERASRVSYLSDHYLKINEDSAVDKLYIIKQDDLKLYRDIIAQMSAKNAKQTSSIVEKIRNKEMKDGDLLVKAYNEALNIENDEISLDAAQIEQAELIIAKNQIKSRIGEQGIEDVLNAISNEKLANVLFYMDEIEKNFILGKLNKEKAKEVKNIVDTLKYEQDNLKEIANILNKKPVNDAINYIETNQDLSPEQLAEIFDHMDLTKASKVAAGIKDKERLDDALFQLTILERLNDNSDGKAKDISELVDFITEYDTKVSELVQFYRKVEPQKAAKVFEKMLDNNRDVSVLELNDPTGIGEKLFKTTDRKIALDVLGGMRPKDVSNIITNMTDEYAQDFTKYFSQPERAIDADGEVAQVGEDGYIYGDNGKISLKVSFDDDNIDILGKEFKQRAGDLASSFNTMNTDELVKIVDKMMKGDDFSRRTIVGVLYEMDSAKRATLLDSLPTGTGATISSMMTTGNFNKTYPTSQYETLDKVSGELAKVYNEMEPIPLARMIKRTYDDAYDYEDTTTLNSLIRILEKVNPDVLSPALDLLNPDMSMEITDLIYRYKNTKEVNQ